MRAHGALRTTKGTTMFDTFTGDITMTTDKSGKVRARYFDRRQQRSFPMPMDAAEEAILAGRARLVESFT